MRWLQAAVLVLSVLAMIGCPSEFGKDGRLNKAAHKDVQEQLVIKRCSDAYKEKVCKSPQRNEQKCLECG